MVAESAPIGITPTELVHALDSAAMTAVGRVAQRADRVPSAVHLFPADGQREQVAGALGHLIRAWARHRGFPLLAPAVETAAPTAFGVARGLLRGFLPDTADAGPPWVASFGPELSALLPELHARIAAPDLRQIALGGTKRRLHHDSERLFRLVSAFTSIAGGGLTAMLERHGGPTVLLIDDAEHCDRYSLACLLHLLRTAATPPLLILVTATQDVRPSWLGSEVTLTDPVLAAWTDAEGEQQALLRRFLAATGAQAIAVRSSSGRAGAAAPRPPAARALMNGPAPSPASGCPEASCPDAEHEGAEVMLAHREVAGGDGAKGAARALRLIQRSFGFTLNYELILLCCRIALASESAAARLPALQFAGLAHAYLGYHDRAAEIFAHAHAQAPTPEARAQLSYYRGLVASKRLEHLDEGRRWFECGLRAVSGRPGDAARIERGWLRNGLALTAWRQARPDEAEELIMAALAETADSDDDPQLLNLRVNLVNNLSVLLEDRGDYAAALATWRKLAVWEAFVRGGTFSKSYRYRESWLLLALGEVGEAYGRARMSLAVARGHRDVFHMNLIGAACCYLACRGNDLDAAAEWAAESVSLTASLGHRPAQAHAHGQSAHVRYQAGDHDGAICHLQQGLDIAPGTGISAVLAEALGRLRAGDAPGSGGLGPDDPLFGIWLDHPKPKLTTPFPIAHLITDAAFASSTHDLALGTVRT